MALIRCPECDKKISDTSNTCPKCGYDLEEAKAKQDQTAFFKFLGIAFLVIIPLSIILAMLGVLV